jgi:serine protease AprX
MKKILTATLAAALLSVLVTGPSLAGRVTNDLRDAIRDAAPNDKVDVIVRFANKADLRALKRLTKKKRKRAVIRALRRRADLDQNEARRLLRILGNKHRTLWINNSIAARVPAHLVDDLAALPGVAKVKLDAVVQAFPHQSAGGAMPEVNLTTIGADAMWAMGLTGTGTVVANMDTGVDGNHSDVGLKWRGGTNSWFDPYGQHSTPEDYAQGSSGHGTGSMGIMVGGVSGYSGTAYGVAPGAQWVAVKMFDDAGNAQLSDIHAGFQWLLDPDGDPYTDDAPVVANNSWGFDGQVNQCDTEFQQDIQTLKAAGIGAVFSAGNLGQFSATSVPPANLPESFSVGAVDDDDLVLSSSSRGPSACGGTYPNVVAPGDAILTAYPGGPFFYQSFSGTSAAAPHVAGAMALLSQAFPNASVETIEDAIEMTAVDLGDSGPDNDYGYGRLDVAAAHDCLEVDVTRALYRTPDLGTNPDRLIVWAVPSDCVAAETPMTVAMYLDDGTTAQYNMVWSASKNRWQKVITNISANNGGATPVSVFVSSDELSGNSLVTDKSPSGNAAADADDDNDGYGAAIDCDDGDPAIHPNALEAKNNGVDEDCVGGDFTIDFTRSEYLDNSDKLIVWATSDHGDQAGLKLKLFDENGSSFKTFNMTWNANKSRWQRAIANYSTKSWAVAIPPAYVEVYGAEGSETKGVE